MIWHGLPELPDWITGVIVAVIAASGGWMGGTTRKRRQRSDEKRQRADERDSFIDQLQEELAVYRDAADRRATAQDERMNRLERMSDAYRTYAHRLRGHIYDQEPPPPPPWPDELPQ